MEKYFIQTEGSQKGPFSKDQLAEIKINGNTLVWFDGIDDWKEAKEIDELKDIIVKLPPPINKTTNFNSNTKPKPVVQKNNSKRSYKSVFIFFLIIIALFIGYNEIQKKELEERLRQQEYLEAQRRNAEIERQRQERLAELNTIYENTLNKLRLEKENLSEIKKFKFLRTASEKQNEIETQLKVIRKLELRLEGVKREIESL
jgi:GYF domain 2